MWYSRRSRWIGGPEVGVANVENQALTYTSVAITVFLLYDYCEQNIRPSCWGRITNDVMASSYSGSRGSASFLISLLFTWQFDCSRSDKAHLGISCIHFAWHGWHSYYRNVQVGRYRHYYMYSCGFLWFVQHGQFLIGLDRSDTSEQCLICVSFIYLLWLPSWSFDSP